MSQGLPGSSSQALSVWGAGQKPRGRTQALSTLTLTQESPQEELRVGGTGHAVGSAAGLKEALPLPGPWPHPPC